MAEKHQRTFPLSSHMHSNTICFNEPMGWSQRIAILFFINHLEVPNSKDTWDRAFLDQLP